MSSQFAVQAKKSSLLAEMMAAGLREVPAVVGLVPVDADPGCADEDVLPFSCRPESENAEDGLSLA